jgi:hypothetical protein
MAGESQAIFRRGGFIAGLTIGGATETVTGDTHAAYHQTVPSSSTDYEIDFPVTVAALKAVAIVADQDIDLYTNAVHSGSPDQHFALKANVPILWQVGEPAALKPLTTDVTKFYAGVATTTATVLTIAIVANSH